MKQGRVYTWTPDATRDAGGSVDLGVVPLLRLGTHPENGSWLSGRYVRVLNAGRLHEPVDSGVGAVRTVPIENAQPDADGNFLFDPGRGGGRMDKRMHAGGRFRWRYIQAAHFGEVNTYYHLDRIAAYVDDLLRELGSPELPRVTALVNAHHGATEQDGIRDGVWNGVRWRAFQGGHYRLPGRRFSMAEPAPVSPDGEIHLGPGYRLLNHGALVEAAGARYRANASHNAGTLYHEYGHHISRHTADFMGNRLRSPQRQRNRKTALDEGTCDYWAATLLDTPHIWTWHRRHEGADIHPRSLASPATMSDYDLSPTADPHTNGTIWGAALWDMRTRLAMSEPDGIRRSDLLVLQALLLLGTLRGDAHPPTARSVRHARKSYAAGLAAVLQADETLYAGRHSNLIRASFEGRDIGLKATTEPEWSTCVQ